MINKETKLQEVDKDKNKSQSNAMKSKLQVEGRVRTND